MRKDWIRNTSDEFMKMQTKSNWLYSIEWWF